MVRKPVWAREWGKVKSSRPITSPLYKTGLLALALKPRTFILYGQYGLKKKQGSIKIRLTF
jgi:hypothetical protein